MTPDRWEQINRLYYAALEVETKERVQFLEESCQGDSEMRKEVETLLAMHEKAGEFLDQPAIEVVARQVSEEPPSLVGRQLGPYQIMGLLGSGGMGEVYKAKDTRLNRTVAIKVIPKHLTERKDLRLRFEREARALAGLNHPNICAVYDIGSHEGVDFLVMEYLEGGRLSERLKKGPLPLKQLLQVALEITSALEQAHRRGVVHRDLKPGNIMLTEGGAKLLDFGLAKQTGGAGALRALSLPNARQGAHSTMESLTEEGMILGTVEYMAPEQVEGKEADARTDIFALGAVIYEMATGKRAFEGKSQASMMAAILTSEPPSMSRLQPLTPPVLEHAVQRCLAKNPDQRWQNAYDLAIELKWITEGHSAMVVPAAAKIRRGSRARLVSLSTLALVLLVLAGWLVSKLTQPSPSFPVVRSVIRLESGHWLDGMRFGLQRPSRNAVALSKDGRFIVYSAITENPEPQAKPQLYLRRTDQWRPGPLLGRKEASTPFFRPMTDGWDSGQATQADEDLHRRGSPRALCDAAGRSEQVGGLITASCSHPVKDVGLFRISAEGGDPESLTTPDKTKEEYSHRLPHCLPDGKGVLFTIMREANDLQPRIAWLDLKTRKWRVLMEDAADARYVPTGHLVFLRQGTLMVVPFDLERHELTGQPVPAIANVMQALNATDTYNNTAAGQFSISDSGWLVYAEGGILPDSQNSLVWVDQKGRAEPIASFKAPFFAPRLSPDGQRIAYTTLGREQRVWVYDLNRGTASRLTGEGKVTFVTWTPDGKRVAFGWLKSGPPISTGNPPMEAPRWSG